MAKQTFSMRSQVLQSKVCSPKPLLPGEIRANPILCLQGRHIGRSTMEDELRIAQHPRKRYELSTNRSVRCPTLRQNFGPGRQRAAEGCREARPPRTACQNHARIAVWQVREAEPVGRSAPTGGTQFFIAPNPGFRHIPLRWPLEPTIKP